MVGMTYHKLADIATIQGQKLHVVMTTGDESVLTSCTLKPVVYNHS